MPSPIISVENLSKSYTISHQSGSNGKAGGYRRLSEELLSYPRQLLSRFSSLASRDSSSEEFWALKDVNFEVNEGEVVGIIGRNGAGKSTLLKILSRITEPTSGRVTLRGRVASLLEVGTGFHPELTGRENVFLNGAILGMSRREIVARFDAIVDFAGVAKFIDTPVKRYSSGMYVRLAFAVAAHLEPEILIVDEVLAVGDAQFQAKCVVKMKDIAKQEGRTILFVTHDLKNASRLCTKGVMLNNGSCSQMDAIGKIVDQYMSTNRTYLQEERHFSDELNILNIHISPSQLYSDGSLALEATLRSKEECIVRDLHFYLSTPTGDRVTLFDCRYSDRESVFDRNKLITVRSSVDRCSLVPGDYLVGFCVRTDHCFNAIQDLAKISVNECENSLLQYDREFLGVLSLKNSFSITSTDIIGQRS